jgi:hypothetical protein
LLSQYNFPTQLLPSPSLYLDLIFPHFFIIMT